MSYGAMKGEAQLINLMHCRYVDALRDFVTMVAGSGAAVNEVENLIQMANKLSTMNVHKYGTEWGKEPSPQKIVVLAPDGNISCTEKYIPDS